MASTLLPTTPDRAAMLTEILPSVMAVKSLAEGTHPLKVVHALNAIPAGILVLENANNTVEAYRNNDLTTAAMAAGQSALWGVVASGHVIDLFRKEKPSFAKIRIRDVAASAVVIGGLSYLQERINVRLGKYLAPKITYGQEYQYP